MSLTKKDAKAIVAAAKKINAALDTLEHQLSSTQHRYADAYYLTHMRNTTNGRGHGSMPLGRAEEMLGGYQ